MKKISVLFLLLLSFITNAQNYKWTNYKSGNSLYAISSDSGNIWVGSNIGLVKMSRKNNAQTLLNLSDSSFPADAVYGISRDTNGNFWMTTNKGLVKYKNSAWQIFNKSNSSIPSESLGLVNAVQSDNIWFTYSDYVVRFNGTKFDTVRLGNDAMSNFFFSGLESDINKNIWVSCNKGLYLINHLTMAVTKITSVCRAITADSSGNILACVINVGIVKFKAPLYNSSDTIPFLYPWLNYYSIKSAKDSTLWLNTEFYMFRYRKGTWSQVQTVDSAFSGEIYAAMHIDDSSNIWLVKIHKGFVKYTGIKKEVYPVGFPHLLDNSVTSLAFDQKNGLWITYASPKNTMSCNNNEKWTHYKLSDSLVLNALFTPISKVGARIWIDTAIIITYNASGDSTWYVADIANKQRSQKIKMDYDSLVWIATSNGLKCFNKGTWTVYDTNNSNLPVNKLYCLAISPENNLIITTQPYKTHKVGYIYSGKIGSLTESYKIGGVGSTTNYFATSLVYDDHKTIWIGETNVGLFNSQNNFAMSLNTDNSMLPSNSVIELNFDHKEKQLWIGTEWGGAAKIDSSGHWRVFDKNNSPLLFNSVMDVVFSKDSSIWMAIRFNGLAHLVKDGTYTDTTDTVIKPLLPCKAAFTHDSVVAKVGNAYQTTYQFYDRSFGGEADISEYPFEAIVQGPNEDCGLWAISFTGMLDSVHSICGITVDGSTYIARNLPDELRRKGSKIRLKIRKAENHEIGACTAFGPTYAWTYVVKAVADTNKTSLITSWLWDFGDGYTSKLQDPKHIFLLDDVAHNVCLSITTADSCTSNTCKSINSPSAFLSGENYTGIKIYPNPTTGMVTIEIPEMLTGEINVADMVGNIVASQKITAAPTVKVDLSAVAPGMYFIKISDGKNTITKKVVKE